MLIWHESWLHNGKGNRRKGSNRVLRGGSWNNTPANARVANRDNWDPANRNNNVGFRLASTGKSPRSLFFYGKTGRGHLAVLGVFTKHTPSDHQAYFKEKTTR